MVLLIPCFNTDTEVWVIDSFSKVLDKNKKKEYYKWSKPVEIKYLFDLIKTYPNKTLITDKSKGKIRVFTKIV